jgi:hypothetical protein
MALSMDTTSKQGFTAPNAYIRIQSISIIGKTQMEFSIGFFKTAETESSFDYQTWSCAYDVNGSNPFAQSYKYLKTLPSFATATDC